MFSAVLRAAIGLSVPDTRPSWERREEGEEGANGEEGEEGEEGAKERIRED